MVGDQLDQIGLTCAGLLAGPVEMGSNRGLGDAKRLGTENQALTAFLAVLDQHTLTSVALKPKDFRAVFQTAPRSTA